MDRPAPARLASKNQAQMVALFMTRRQSMVAIFDLGQQSLRRGDVGNVPRRHIQGHVATERIHQSMDLCGLTGPGRGRRAGPPPVPLRRRLPKGLRRKPSTVASGAIFLVHHGTPGKAAVILRKK